MNTQNIKFLYWNTQHKQQTESVLTGIFKTWEPDILILGECSKTLDEDFTRRYQLEQLILKQGEKEQFKIRIYYKTNIGISLLHLNNMSEVEHSDVVIETLFNGELIYRTIKRIARIVKLELNVNGHKTLLSCIHFPSRRNQDELSQLQIAYNYKAYILEGSEVYQDKVIIVGDFNMNPFDAGMVEPHGFYALNHRDVIRDTRIFQHSPEKMLYNPCWWLMSDIYPQIRAIKSSGSHYFDGAPSKKLFWHMYDQVLLSKDMIHMFNNDDLEIIQEKNIIQDVTGNNRPKEHSDHLPLKFSLNF